MNSRVIWEIIALAMPSKNKLHSASPRAITFLQMHGSVQLFPKLHSNSCDYLYKFPNLQYIKTMNGGKHLFQTKSRMEKELCVHASPIVG